MQAKLGLTVEEAARYTGIGRNTLRSLVNVQELLGHEDVNLTLNVYAHSARESKRNSAKLLDTLQEDE